MIEITPDEARVLGVLIEKEKTVPESYPLTLNAAVNGASQKNNRDPVQEYGEDQIRSAIAALQSKGLVIRVDNVGSRVPKYKHNVNAKLGLNEREKVVLAEMLLRGPSTLGELRGRASRMHPLETLEVVKATLDQMMAKEEPLVQRLSPAPGSRAERYAQLLCPDFDESEEADGESTDAEFAEEASESVSSRPTAAAHRLSVDAQWAARVEKLELQVTALRAALQKLAQSLGEPDPTTGPAFEETGGTAADSGPIASGGESGV